MKSLSESLFDTNVISKDVVLGNMYNFETPDWMFFSWRNGAKLLPKFLSSKSVNSFGKDKWDVEDSDFIRVLKMSSNSKELIRYVTVLINILLDIPANIIFSGKSSSFVRDDVKKYLLKYCKPTAKKDMTVWIREDNPSTANVQSERLYIEISSNNSTTDVIKFLFFKK
jgi:hypothetical protein